MKFRAATAHDIEAVAALHADSWRRNYRGAFADTFLDGDVFSDRLAVWRDRFTNPAPRDRTVIAEVDGVVVGFAHTILEDDTEWGALLDNLHVTHTLRGSGVGTKLIARSAQSVVEHEPQTGLYLWVLEANTAARSFYGARGGEFVGRQMLEAPGGGTVASLRVAWPDPAALLAGV